MVCLLHHEPVDSREDIENRFIHQVKSRSPKRPHHVEQATRADNPWGLAKEEKPWAASNDGIKHKYTRCPLSIASRLPQPSHFAFHYTKD